MFGVRLCLSIEKYVFRIIYHLYHMDDNKCTLLSYDLFSDFWKLYLSNQYDCIIAPFGWADKSANSQTYRYSHTWKCTYINTIVTTNLL